MFRARMALLFLFLIVSQITAPTAWAQSGARHALVIGNSAYSHTDPLRNPANDALLVSGALEKVGFKVQLHIDLTQKEFRKALREYSRVMQAAGSGAVSLIYFAGHGTQVAGRNFLLPTDANVEFEDDVPIETVALDDVMTQLDGTEGALNIFILDACRNNPFKRGARAAVRGLAPVKAQKGTLVAYSTAPGTVALDGDSDNSPYAVALTRNLAAPGLSIEKVFKNVRVEVDGATSGKQTPWEESSLFGDFIFVEADMTGMAGMAALPPTASSGGGPQASAASEAQLAAETAFWNTVKDSDNPVAVQSYLDTFPKGLFAPIAKIRFEELKKKQEVRVAFFRDRSGEGGSSTGDRVRKPRARPENCTEFYRTDGTDRYCASSVLPPQYGNSYNVAGLLDNSNYTAWFENSNRDGVGEWLSIDFGTERKAEALVVKNGYNKDRDLYYKNGRVRGVELMFANGDKRSVELRDEPGEQTLAIVNAPASKWVQLKIVSVYPGAKYKDTGINELRLVSSPVTP